MLSPRAYDLRVEILELFAAFITNTNPTLNQRLSLVHQSSIAHLFGIQNPHSQSPTILLTPMGLIMRFIFLSYKRRKMECHLRIQADAYESNSIQYHPIQMTIHNNWYSVHGSYNGNVLIDELGLTQQELEKLENVCYSTHDIFWQYEQLVELLTIDNPLLCLSLNDIMF